ncbi:MAG: succinate dehydrogenase assembly factor 2 [Pseudomonadota bacterium]
MHAQSDLNRPLPRELWLKRLTYRSWHRGCKETDLVLGTYCATHVEQLDTAQMALFEAFLDEDDADIWSWLTEKTPCPNPAYTALLADLRALKIA